MVGGAGSVAEVQVVELGGGVKFCSSISQEIIPRCVLPRPRVSRLHAKWVVLVHLDQVALGMGHFEIIKLHPDKSGQAPLLLKSS